jgi:hypothetical protein
MARKRRNSFLDKNIGFKSSNRLGYASVPLDALGLTLMRAFLPDFDETDALDRGTNTFGALFLEEGFL